jgi:hypothetical protein
MGGCPILEFVMTKTQIAILWGLAAVVLIVFVALSWFIARPAQGDMPMVGSSVQAYRLPAVSFSARSFYPRAEQAAKSWKQDAGLVSASASWPFVRLDHFSVPVDWTFQFFSPSTQRIYVVNVNETQVSLIRESLAPYPLPTISMGDWQLDSHEALNAWLNHGGGGLLDRYPVVDVSVRLRQGAGDSLEWVVVGAVRDDPTIQMARIRAVDGAVLE